MQTLTKEYKEKKFIFCNTKLCQMITCCSSLYMCKPESIITIQNKHEYCQKTKIEVLVSYVLTN